jgi:hypothetical protein
MESKLSASRESTPGAELTERSEQEETEETEASLSLFSLFASVQVSPLAQELVPEMPLQVPSEDLQLQHN